MPRNIDEGFADFLSNLKATAAETAAAKSHRASIEACLESNFGLSRFVRIGSFGNGTSVSGYSDVDYLACIPTNQLTQTSTASLTKIRNALDVRFPSTGVKVSCPAISVPFGTYRSEDTEVVPADYIKDEHGFKVYEIADCAGGWMRACPDAHNAYVKEVDDRHHGKVKALIRFIKAWKYHQGVPISSFYLEMRIAKYADGENAIIYPIDIKIFLRKLLDESLPRMQDPMGFSGYISACKSDAARAETLSKLSTAVSRAEKAWVAQDGNKISEAFEWWQKFYDTKFPSYYRT